MSLAANEIANGPAAARLVTVFGAQLDAAQAIERAVHVFTFFESHLSDQRWLVGERPTSGPMLPILSRAPWISWATTIIARTNAGPLCLRLFSNKGLAETDFGTSTEGRREETLGNTSL